MHNVVIKITIASDGTLVPASKEDAGKLKVFAAGAKKGQELEAYITAINGDDKTAGQLAKVHALIRELANSTGHTTQEIKLLIKERTGLRVPASDTTEASYKSFGICNKQEMSNAIEECIALGHDLGIYLY